MVTGQRVGYIRFWELALLWRLREALRSGDVWVEGSARYADPEIYLLDKASWDGMPAQPGVPSRRGK